MTLEEFINCKIGDEVLTTSGKTGKIEDIDRSSRKLTTGNGHWRDYRTVKMPNHEVIERSINTTFIPSDIIVLSRKILLKYGFPRTIILRTIESAGPNGFVGSNEDLASRAEFVSYDYLRYLIREMAKEGLINKKRIKGNVYRFTIKG